MLRKFDSIRGIKKGIIKHVLGTKPRNYAMFLNGLEAFKYLSFSADRGDMLETFYLAFRLIDDVIDNDLKLPFGYRTSQEYIQSKIDFLSTLSWPGDDSENLLKHGFNVAEKLGLDVHKETELILRSLLFDAKRVGSRELFSEAELKEHFYRLDLEGSIKGALKVFNDDPGKYELLKHMGQASRIYYNLRDFKEDIEKGYVNIAKEDFERHKITDEDLETIVNSNKIPGNVNNWMREQVKHGLIMIGFHKKIIRENDFNLLGRLALRYAFQMPAERYFKSFIKKDRENQRYG